MSANQGDASEPSTSTQSVRNPQPGQPDVLGQTAKTKPEDFRIDKFSKGDRLQANGSNFFAWKGLIEMVLIGNGWFDHVSETSVAPASTSDAHILWTQVDNLVKGQLCLNMEQSLYGELQAHFTSAKELWSILHKRFGERGGLAEEVAHTELRNKRIQTGETFDQHIVRLRELRTNYLNCGVSLRDSEWHAIIIRSLSDHPDWLHMQVYGHIIRNSEELIQVLRLQEAQIPRSTFPHENALQTQQRQRSLASPCSNCHRQGHSIQNCWAPGGGAMHRRPPNYRTPADLIAREQASLALQIQQLQQQHSLLSSQLSQQNQSSSSHHAATATHNLDHRDFAM